MFSIVLVEVILTSETSVTFVTCKCLLCSMNSFDVQRHTTCLSKPTTTVRTLVWFVTSVSPHVCVKVARVNKTFRTLRTFVWLEASVLFCVLCKTGRRMESLLTGIALILFILCMYSQV